MPRQYSLLFVIPPLFTLAILYLMFNDGNPDKSINEVIGDESYIHVFGEAPGDDVPDYVRIQTHLDYVESVLRNRPVDHLSSRQKENRERYLDLLVKYSVNGEFPHNDGHPDLRRPAFISNDDKICAVGYLVEQTLGRETAETIGEKFKYSFIREIDNPLFDEWVEASGFTIEELAMIQPMYGPVIVEELEINENNISLSYGLGSSLVTGANILYLSNNPANPWMFDNPQSNHWYGLAAGTASVLLGALNLDNSNSFLEPLVQADVSQAPCINGCPQRNITITNHARTGVSAANIGVGLFSVVRAGYHLLNGTGNDHEPSGIGVTQINTGTLETGTVVPAFSYSIRF